MSKLLTIEEAAERRYRPSNGTAGEMFYAEWCARCRRDEAFRQSEGGEDGCEILTRTLICGVDDPEYPTEWIYGANGDPCCTAFDPSPGALPPRCSDTLDLFGSVQ